MATSWQAGCLQKPAPCVAEARGKSERAARLFEAAEILREAVGYQHSPEGDAWREPYLAAARSHLDEVAWEDKKAEPQLPPAGSLQLPVGGMHRRRQEERRARTLRRGGLDNGAPGLGAQGTPMGARSRKTARDRRRLGVSKARYDVYAGR